jgi:hypothetical protein
VASRSSGRFSYDPGEYIRDPNTAIPLLAEYLSEGCLALAIGAGASAGLGLPDWHTLVRRCVEAANKQTGSKIDIPAGTDPRSLGRAMDRVETAVAGKPEMGRSADYRKLVHTCLYHGVTYNDDSLLTRPLLIALGALLMHSRRGSIREVFNFNFDDVLDWYLALHGLDVQVVTRAMELLREADLTVFHPHGLLPFDGSTWAESDFLILSQYSYDEKLGDHVDPWLNLFRTAMTNRVVLFVGLSGDDETFFPTLVAVKKLVATARFTGFWLLGPKDSQERVTDLSDRNIVPLRLEKYEDYPEFLLQICRQALIN